MRPREVVWLTQGCGACDFWIWDSRLHFLVPQRNESCPWEEGSGARWAETRVPMGWGRTIPSGLGPPGQLGVAQQEAA